MVHQITDGGEDILHTHVHGFFRVSGALDQMGEVESHLDTLESQPVIHGNNPVAILRQAFEPGKHIRVVPASGDEAASEDIQDRRTLQRIAGNDNRIIDVHEEVAGVPLGDLVSGFLLSMAEKGDEKKRHQEEKSSFHRSDSMSSTSLSTASVSGICRSTGVFPR